MQGQGWRRGRLSGTLTSLARLVQVCLPVFYITVRPIPNLPYLPDALTYRRRSPFLIGMLSASASRAGHGFGCLRRIHADLRMESSTAPARVSP
ncbi:uncharacterized protein B0H18DRAFT_1018842 [Fomitopsis serialis]|uniref:uncharacterized protein n=1 Tax=Fomitopsis serialis TaxID=139415 RepID=UPI0020084BD4|nr:uncharacterized protein B0H18DRAFT_1018842 [Neoantrodia serialis]KAH9922047.1 hypothetical protein B0H18DRAFT_1018842 [Neoantrodia serialis]